MCSTFHKPPFLSNLIVPIFCCNIHFTFFFLVYYISFLNFLQIFVLIFMFTKWNNSKTLFNKSILNCLYFEFFFHFLFSFLHHILLLLMISCSKKNVFYLQGTAYGSAPVPSRRQLCESLIFSSVLYTWQSVSVL